MFLKKMITLCDFSWTQKIHTVVIGVYFETSSMALFSISVESFCVRLMSLSMLRDMHHVYMLRRINHTDHVHCNDKEKLILKTC